MAHDRASQKARPAANFVGFRGGISLPNITLPALWDALIPFDTLI